MKFALLLLASLLALQACGGGDPDPECSTTVAQDDQKRIAQFSYACNPEAAK